MFNWVTELVQEYGYVAIALLMFVENVFPPIPSELIMPMAGFSAARGDLSLVGVILSGTFGSLCGAYFWYQLGRWYGRARLLDLASRHGRWLTIGPQDVKKAQSWFEKHGGKAVFFGRLLPAIRTLISVPAGIAEMPRIPFLLYSALGTIMWSSILAVCGYLLESQYDKVSAYVDPASNVVLAALGLTYVYRVYQAKGRNEQSR
ncbi:MAG TPA: DedA family protein [Beijerinckiaceae bacterium]|jgi:membrane protein DedA with SNARE-associated domain